MDSMLTTATTGSSASMLRRRCVAFVLVLFAIGSTACFAQAESLSAQLEPLLAAHQGKVAVAVKQLKTGEEFQYRAHEPMPTASLIKLPIMIEAYRQADAGRLLLDRMVTLREEDKVPGSGILTTHFSAGAQLSLRDVIRLMIVYSDNTATNLVLDQIGLSATNETLESLGWPNTKIHAKVFRRESSILPERSERFGLGSTTAAEMVAILEQLHLGSIASEAACRAMLDNLYHCSEQEMLTRHLPAGTRVAHKSGAVTHVRCEAGMIESPAGPLAVCVLTDENVDRRWVPDNAAQLLCAEVGRRVYAHFNPPVAGTFDADRILEVGAQGELVEALQRTLNARLSPSPELDVDGEFGPATRGAVVRFQETRSLAVTGRVDEAMWKSLGPLSSADAPAIDPVEVNKQELPKSEADKLTGLPWVTCRAWAIADGRSGELLRGSGEDESLEIASTTKIMTAYIVLDLARDQPDLLQQQVVFSERADQTVGSTAGVKAGEKLPVSELLFGLLLPSGNDAAVALAEHFGPRFEPPGEDAAIVDPLLRFVAEMNRTAAKLGMRNTTYANPHGLSEATQHSTVRDLVLLSHAAWQLPALRGYTGTRQHATTLTGPGGYQRNVVWRNSNQLLGIEGYTGIKTGTTTAAGACLVSVGNRGDDSLLVVVLGSTSSDARYTDTRNLFRWAWLQRGHRDPP